MQDQDAVPPEEAVARVVAGRYRLLSPLGEGGMGTVWRARDEMLRREVAIKEVRAPAGMPAAKVERMYTRLEREAWAAARIAARNVITVHDVVTDAGRPWVVMELVRGRSLGELIAAEGALAPREAARIGAEVLAALRAAHDAGVLHRDVKPANVLLSDDDRVILTDFGIAMVQGDTALTLTGEVVGSPEYLAPEQALGRTPGPATDLWSLGVLLHTAVQGRSPFRRENTLSTLRAVVDEEPPAPHRAGPLGPVIEGLLRKDPEQRTSAERTAEQLRLVAAGGTADGDLGSTAEGVVGGTAEGVVEWAVDTDAPTDAVTVDAATTGAATVGTATADAATADAATAGTATADAEPTAVATGDGRPATATDAGRPATATDAGRPATATDAGRPAAAVDPRTALARVDATPTAEATPAPPRNPSPAAEAATTPPQNPSPAAAAATVTAHPLPAPSLAPPQDPPTPPATVIGNPSPQPAERRRRAVYVWGAAAAAFVVLAGGLGYALANSGGDDGDKGGTDAKSATATASGRAQDGATVENDGAAAARPPVTVSVTGTHTTYAGTCPPPQGQAPTFTATFAVSELPTTFTYRWVSSGGSVVDRTWRKLSFAADGPRTHEESVSVTTWAKSGSLSSAMGVEIKSSQQTVSDTVPFTLTCE
jgi:hypothetical protein